MPEQQRASTLDRDCVYATGNKLNGTDPSDMSTEDKITIGRLVTAEPFPGERIYRLSCPVSDCTAECLVKKTSGKLRFIVESATETSKNIGCIDGNSMQSQ